MVSPRQVTASEARDLILRGQVNGPLTFRGTLDLSGEPTVTTGIVSATGRSLAEPNGVKLVDLRTQDRNEPLDLVRVAVRDDDRRDRHASSSR